MGYLCAYLLKYSALPNNKVISNVILALSL